MKRIRMPKLSELLKFAVFPIEKGGFAWLKVDTPVVKLLKVILELALFVHF